MTLKFHIPEPYNRDFPTSVAVSTEGQFSTTVPAEVTELFKAAGVSLGQNRLHREGYFTCNTFDGLKGQIHEKIVELCSEEVVSVEKVLRYFIRTACTYTCDPAPAHFLPNAQNGSEWREGTDRVDSSNPATYGFQFYAAPYTKTTYRYTSTGRTREKYETLCDHNCDAADLREDPVQWLAHVVNQDSGQGRFCYDSASALSEVPLTAENVDFFVGLYKSLFALNERIKPFLTPEGIQQLAAARAGVRLLT